MYLPPAAWGTSARALLSSSLRSLYFCCFLLRPLQTSQSPPVPSSISTAGIPGLFCFFIGSSFTGSGLFSLFSPFFLLLDFAEACGCSGAGGGGAASAFAFALAVALGSALGSAFALAFALGAGSGAGGAGAAFGSAFAFALALGALGSALGSAFALAFALGAGSGA